MAVNVTCGNCRTAFVGKEEHRGRAFQCPKCSTALTVPRKPRAGLPPVLPAARPAVSRASGAPAADNAKLPDLVIWYLFGIGFVQFVATLITGFLIALKSGSVNPIPAIILLVISFAGISINGVVLSTGSRLARRFVQIVLCLGIFLGACVAGIQLLLTLATMVRFGIASIEMAVFGIPFLFQCLIVGLAIAFYRSLSHVETMRFFGLICPRCNTPGGSPVDFLFRRARCAKCDHEW